MSGEMKDEAWVDAVEEYRARVMMFGKGMSGRSRIFGSDLVAW